MYITQCEQFYCLRASNPRYEREVLRPSILQIQCSCPHLEAQVVQFSTQDMTDVHASSSRRA
jgi:hypothetical protein